MIKLILITFFSLFLSSCTELKDQKTRLQIIVNNNCKDKVDDNNISLRVEQVGGDYKSRRFSVTVGDPNGIIIDLPKGGTYNVRGYNYNGLFDLVGSEWKGSVYVEDNKTFKQWFTCSDN